MPNIISHKRNDLIIRSVLDIFLFMDIQKLTRFSNKFIQKYIGNAASIQPVERLLILSYTMPTNLEATLYEPVCCLILQGRKETVVGDRTVNFGAGESLIVSHETPVVSQVTSATLKSTIHCNDPVLRHRADEKSL